MERSHIGKRDYLHKIKRYSKFRNFPGDLTRTMLSHAKYSYESNRDLDFSEKEIMLDLPPRLRRSIVSYIKETALRDFPFVDKLSVSFILGMTNFFDFFF